MAADGRAFGISFGVYSAVALFVLFFFGFARRSKLCKKYYAPKRYMRGLKHKPKNLPTSFWGWVLPVYRTTEDELIKVAGFDAAMYLRIITFGTELFLYLTIFCCAAVLPLNLVGHQVKDYLTAPNQLQSNNYTYWIPPPPPVNPNLPPAPPPPPGVVGINPPNFYTPTPPAPPGLSWWHYQPGVPPLPDPGTVDPTFAGYQWRYDPSWRPITYTFNNMDQLTMSNVQQGSPRLWLHCLMTWIVSLICYGLIWKHSKGAVALRLRYLQQLEGAEPRTVLVRDIPGVYYGTMLHRLDAVVLHVLPGFIKNPLKKVIGGLVSVGKEGFNATAGKLTDTVTNREPKPSTKVKRNTSDVFYEPADVLPSHGSIPSVRALDPEIEKARAAVERDSQPLVSGGGPSSSAPGSPDKPWAPRPTEEPEFANEPPALEEAFRSVTDTDPWERARLLMHEHGMSMQEMVEREYEELFPGEVEAVHVVRDTAPLNGLVKEYDKLKGKLEDLLDDYTSKKRRHKKIKRKTEAVMGLKYGEWGREKYGTTRTKVDALEWYSERMQELRRRILEEREKTSDNVVPSAFVTFKKLVSQVKSVSSTQHHDTSTWLVSAAPGSDEVIWGNVRWRSWERSVRFIGVWGAFVALTLFYSIPILFLQALINVDQLKRIHFFAVIIDLPILRSIITAILPGLMLKIFLALLPYLLSILGRLQGLHSQAAVDFSVINKYYIFQFITVFLVSFIAGSVLNQATSFIHDPFSIISTLGTSAPLTSIFFLTYIELNALAAVPVGFLRIVGLVLYWLLTRVAATERAKARLWQRQTAKYGPTVPQHTITILLGLVFCIMNPVITPVCLIYFLIVTCTEKYNLLYVYTYLYQSGGALWVPVYGQVITALIVFQLFMIGILGVKGSYTSSLVVPLLFITIVFAYVCHGVFARPFQVLSLRGAVDLDNHEQEVLRMRGLKARESTEGEKEQYLAAALKFDEAGHEKLMKEARQMQHILAGDHPVPEEEEEDDKSVASTTDAPEQPHVEMGNRQGAAARAPTGDEAV